MPTDSREEIKAVVEEGLANDEAQVLRERLAAEVPIHLARNGLRLSIHHQLTGDTAGLGFATATEMAAELGEGAARLYREELWYPAAALVRQLLECRYLLTLQSERRDEAAEWMTSTRSEVIARFMPAQMRRRSAKDFRVSEYQSHCDSGGHPSPAGRKLLRRHDEWRDFSSRWLWLDLAQHLTELWETFCAGVALFDPRMDPSSELYAPKRSPDGGEEVATLISLWRRHDPLGTGLAYETALNNPPAVT